MFSLWRLESTFDRADRVFEAKNKEPRELRALHVQVGQPKHVFGGRWKYVVYRHRHCTRKAGLGTNDLIGVRRTSY